MAGVAILGCTGLVSILAVNFFINVLMLASTLYMLQIYDRVPSSRSSDTLLLLTLIVIGTIAAIGLLDATRSSLMSLSVTIKRKWRPLF